jgi:hypothetical protein
MQKPIHADSDGPGQEDVWVPENPGVRPSGAPSGSPSGCGNNVVTKWSHRCVAKIWTVSNGNITIIDGKCYT